MTKPVHRLHTSARSPAASSCAAPACLLGLPLLDAMLPAFARGATAKPPCRAACSASATTWACCRTSSSRADRPGATTRSRPTWSILRDFRNDFTVFSGVSHPDVDGGHPADNCFLTAAPHPGQRRLPQHHLARPVRRRADRPPDALPLAHPRRQRRSRASAASPGPAGGVLIPCEEKPSEVFKRLFLQRHAGGGRRRRRASWRSGRASWTPSPARPSSLRAQRRRARPRAARPVFHRRARPRDSAWSQSREWEKKPQARS